MDKYSENNIRDFLYHQTKYDYIKIISVSRYNNPLLSELIDVTYYAKSEDHFNKMFENSSMIKLTYIINAEKLNEYISLKRNEKINRILHNA